MSYDRKERRLAIIAEHMATRGSDDARRIERDFKVPVTGSAWPTVLWVACLVLASPVKYPVHETLLPSDDELWQIRSYIEFMLTLDGGCGLYHEHIGRQALDEPLPLIGGHNTVSLMKRKDGGWCYRRYSWTQGPSMIPMPEGMEHGATLTLPQLLDRILGYGGPTLTEPNPKWEAWKAAHADVFPAEVAAG